MRIVPPKLTAEMGAKALFSGEYFEEVEIPNEEYCGCGKCDFCEEFPETEPTVLKKVPISWTMIKEIYSRAVEEYGNKLIRDEE